MKLAIMQPYFFPYIGYYQLLNLADRFVLYDTIEYTKKGWINRNRILNDNGGDSKITLPLKSGSDFLQIREREIAETWPAERLKMLARIQHIYRKAPYFAPVFDLVKKCLFSDETNLFGFLKKVLDETSAYLGITTPIQISSHIETGAELKGQSRVIALCKDLTADEYINPIGGVSLYGKDEFMDHGIALYFLKTVDINYRQFDNAFVPSLSIIDVMMFNSPGEIGELLNERYLLV